MIGQYVCRLRYIVEALNRYNIDNDIGGRPL
jgi:hypothetical protein